MNRWEQCVKIHNIGVISAKASFESEKDMTPSIKKFGEEWCKIPKQSLFLSGNTGTGKTHFSCCTMRRILEKVPIYFIRWFKSKNLDEKLLEEIYKYKSCSHMIESICEVPLLVIDDLGVERFTERVERDYYEIIDNRMEHEKLTIISTNQSIQNVEKVYGARIFSRLKTYKWIYFEGEDRRGRQ